MTGARGTFIALEGGEGSGKSTQAALLTEYLRGQGRTVLATREPGGTDGAEAIRELLLRPPGPGWGARAEALLFAAARSDHVERLIEPALERGEWVVCDRFLDSSRAYQGFAGGLGDEAILALHRFGSGDLRADLTIRLAVGDEQAAERIRARPGSADAIGGRGSDYHRDVARAFTRIAKADPLRTVTIDAAASIEDVQAAIRNAIRERFGS